MIADSSKFSKYPWPPVYDIPGAGLSHWLVCRGRLNDLVACTKLHDAAEIPRRADQGEQAAGQLQFIAIKVQSYDVRRIVSRQMAFLERRSVKPD